MAIKGALALGALFALALVTVAPAGPAHGAPFLEVTKTADTADGVCDADCSLREAVMAANAAPGTDTIIVPQGTYTLTIAGAGEDAAATGDLDITDDVAIGAGYAFVTHVQACDASAGPCTGIDRVFHVDPAGVGLDVTMYNLTIRNGYATMPPSAQGGGILNRGTLTIFGSGISRNTANAGGGIWNDGSLTLTRTGLEFNQALGSSAAGGGVYSSGSAIFYDVSLSYNEAAFQGGGMTVSGTTMLTDVSLWQNRVAALSGFGGGIQNGGVLTLLRTSVGGSGGASFGGSGIYSAGSLTMTNSLIHGSQYNGLFIGTPAARRVALESAVAMASLSSATISGSGSAGIYTGAGASLSARNSTIAFNSGGISNLDGSGASLANTIVADNLPGANCSGPVVSQGHNVEDANTCGLTAAGDMVNTDPQLGALQDNGGYMLTHAIPDVSAAVDAGGSADCAVTDQRGAVRPQDGNADSFAACDIGAFEYCPSPIGNTDCDSFPDSTETPCGSNPLDVASYPERMDTPGDDNKDGSINEWLPEASESQDCDGDGFSGRQEQYVFSAANTAHDQACADAWPPDINNDGFVDVIADIIPVANWTFQSVPPAPARYDIAPDPPNGAIGVIDDLTRIASLFGQRCA